VLPGFVSTEEVATLKSRVETLIKEFEATEEFTIFSTKEQPVRPPFPPTFFIYLSLVRADEDEQVLP
jgi:hypothetical protein